MFKKKKTDDRAKVITKKLHKDASKNFGAACALLPFIVAGFLVAAPVMAVNFLSRFLFYIPSKVAQQFLG